MPFERVNGTNTSNAWDYSGYNGHGVINNEVDNATWNGSWGYDGKGAYQFDGINDTIALTPQTAHNFTYNFSILLWTYMNDKNKNYVFISKTDGGPVTTAGWLVYYDKNNDNYIWEFASGEGATFSEGCGGNISARNWTHLAVVKNPNTSSFYVNGVPCGGSSDSSKITASGNPLKIGDNQLSTNARFNGSVDDVMIFNRSLSAEQIMTLYRNRSDIIVSNETTSGQNWTADIVVNDRSEDSAVTRSNQVIVTDLDSCDTLTASKTLTSSVSSTGTCFTIGTSGITLDCSGRTITYGTSGVGAGVENNGNYNHVTIKNCVIKKGATGSTANNHGINITNGALNNTLINNTIVTGGTTNNYGIFVYSNSNSTRIENNTIYTNGTAGANVGIRIDTASFYSQIIGNTIISNGTTTNYGLYLLSGSNHSVITDNKITAKGTSNDNYALLIDTESSNNTFLNNNLSVTSPFPAWVIRDDTNFQINNSFIYNNTFGEIRWNLNNSLGFLSNLTLNISNDQGLGLDRNLFIGNGTIAFNSSAFSPQRINGSANLTLRGLDISRIVGIAKTHNYTTNTTFLQGTRFFCNPNFCNISNYSTDGNVLTFNTTRFSSFSPTANDSTAPTITFVDPTNNSNYSVSTINVNFTVDDDVAVQNCWFGFSNGSNMTLPSCTNFTLTLGRGSHYIKLYANDTSNNINTTLPEVNFSINRLPAISSVILNTTDLTVNNSKQNITVNVTSSDADLNTIKHIYNWRVNGTPIAVLVMPFERINGTNTSNVWDYSGNSNHGNGTFFNVTWNDTGKLGFYGSYVFDGINGTIYVNHSLSLNLDPFTQSYTILAWIKGNPSSHGQRIMEKWAGSGAYPFSFQAGVDVNSFNIYAYDGTNNPGVNTGAVLDDKWHQVGFVVDNAKDSLLAYADGAQVATTANTLTATGANSKAVVIGNDGQLARPFNGTIDEILIFNRSLSTEQIWTLFRNRSDIIVSNETTSGQNWTVDVYPNDGSEDGNVSRSNQVIITDLASCGLLIESLTLGNSVSSTGTCFTIGASGITLDCSGRTITYGTSGVGAGIENNGNYDHITVKNCMIKKGASGSTSNNHGINITNGAFNNTIINTTIVTGGTTDNYGILVRDNSNNTRIENNTIYTNGTSTTNVGIYLQRAALYSQIINNIIITNGTGSNAGIYLLNGTNHSMIRDNNISTRGTGATDAGIRIEDKSVNNSISGSTIYTYGTSTNYGIYLFSDADRNIIENNSIYANGSTSGNEGLRVDTGSDYSQVTGNTIISNGTTLNYGLHLISGVNHSMIRDNNVSTSGTGATNVGIRIETLSSNNSVSGSTVYTYGTSTNYGIYLFSDADRNIIENNSIYANGSISTNEGLRVDTGSDYSQVTGNTIVANGTTSNAGIHLVTSSNHSLIKDNNISTRGTGTSNVGVRIETGSSNNSVSGSIIHTYGTSTNTGFLILTNAYRNIIENNTIYANGSTTANSGIRVQTVSDYSQITGNTIFTNGTTTNYGIYLLSFVNHSVVTGNRVTSGGTGQDNFAVAIESGSSNNTFINNNLSVTAPFPAWVISDDTDVQINNSLIYNNTFGEIRWNLNNSLGFLSNLTLNISNGQGLGLDRNLFIGNNTIAFNSSAFSPLRINGSVNLTLAGLNLSDIIGISKIHNFTTNATFIHFNGFYCNPDSCNISNYITDGNILTFNTTGFSSFSANFSEPFEAASVVVTEPGAPSGAGKGQTSDQPPREEPVREPVQEPERPLPPTEEIPPISGTPPTSDADLTIGEAITITVELENPTDQTAHLLPSLAETPEIKLANEENIREILKQYPGLCGNDLEGNLQVLKLQQQQKVQPIYKAKYSEATARATDALLDKSKRGLEVSSMSGVLYSDLFICANLLRSQLLNISEIILAPGEKVKKEFQIQPGLFVQPRQIKVVFTEAGKIFAEKIVLLQSSFLTGAAIDTSSVGHTFDLYLLIAPDKLSADSDQLYSLEVAINKKPTSSWSRLWQWIYEPPMQFSELYGPFKVDSQAVIFAQQLKYEPEQYRGDYLIKTKVYLKNKLISEDQFAVKLN